MILKQHHQFCSYSYGRQKEHIPIPLRSVVERKSAASEMAVEVKGGIAEVADWPHHGGLVITGERLLR